MHIIITTRVLPFHNIGGMQAITWDLAKAFVKKEVRVTCITTSIENYPQSFTKRGVNVIALADTKPGVYSRNWWKYSKRYIEEYFINDCDVLLSVSASGFSIIGLKSKMKNTVFIFQGHGTSLSEILSKLKLHTLKSSISIIKYIKWLVIELNKCPQFDGIVAVGERVNRDFINSFYRFFLLKKQITFITSGISLDMFNPSFARREKLRSELNIKNTDFVVLIAGRLHKQKGIEQAVLAFYKYKSLHGSSRLIILGDGPEANNIKNLINKLGISIYTHMLGAKLRNQLPRYLNASDVFLFTTFHEEALGLAPLEALACGVPVVASKHLKEINEASEAVISVDPRDINSIVAGMLYAKNIPANKNCLLPARYNLKECANQYLTLFKGLLKYKTTHEQ